MGSHATTLDGETARLLDIAQQKGSIEDLIQRPRTAAKKLGLKLNESTERRLKALRAKLPAKKRSDAVDREVVAFFNKTVVDGRFIAEWATNPETVATALKIKVSKAAHERIRQLDISSFIDVGGGTSPQNVVVVIVIAVVVVFPRSVDIVAVDRSGIAKP